ncbi:acetyl-CoA carboxylase carboxyltransferase subunit alpha [Nocardiopsis alba]|uniref:acetyl-CoA carboxylase carboxyltransferase subunit alpha n=1 Tax=Nocardiopsis alba TaxID=53437 RepID=UPI003D75F3BB
MTETEPEGVAPDSWISCRGCRTLVYGRRLADNFHVCPQCGYHLRLTATQRLAQLLDEGSARPLPVPESVEDPLGFTDSRPYPDRLADARSATGLDEAVVCKEGTICGHRIIVAAMDFRFMGGSLGTAVGERITLAAEAALERRTPLLIVTASGGARMQEGILSLLQMARTSQALARLDEAGILTVSLITDPTYGGVAASFASLTDLIFAEPGARMGFAGPRVIEQTIRRPLPDGFQTAEFLLEHGLLDGVHGRSTLRPLLAKILGATGNSHHWRVSRERESPTVLTEPEALDVTDAWEAVRGARSNRRPTTLDYVEMILGGFQELHGDRIAGECPAMVGGIGWLEDTPVMLIGHQKGHNTRELAARNFGMARPQGYRKAARLIRLADKLGLPLVTLIDTPGAYPGIDAEENGQSVAIAENLRLMSRLSVPTVAVVTGEGGSGGALALALADRVLMMSGAVYSVISPEGCASILWKDAAAAPEAAAALRMDAASLLEQGVVDGVIPEPPGGCGADPALAGERLGAALLDEFARLAEQTDEERRRARYERYASVGRQAPSRTEKNVLKATPEPAR